MIRVCFALIVSVSLALPTVAAAVCCPMPCNDCDIFSSAQLNIVRMNRSAGTIDLIPNIVIRGMSADFALILPTPTDPVFSEVDGAIWDEVAQLSAATFRRTNNGCNSTTVFAIDASANRPANEDVDVHRQETVGNFILTVLTSDTAAALVTWLQENNYNVTPEQSARFAPYVARGWFFTAMKLDLSDPENVMPDRGWNNEVNPVQVSFAATEFEVPLPIISINRASFMPMVFYVIDSRKKALEGFALRYANKLSASENAAVKRQYPVLGAYVSTGSYLTKLRRAFGPSDTMTNSLLLSNASDNDEFRPTGAGTSRGGVSIALLVLLGSMIPMRLWLARRS